MQSTPESIQQIFTRALEHHRAGQIAQAEQLYQEVLDQDPDHFNALHCLGVIAYSSGRINAALELLTKAAIQRPNDAEAQNNLGNALKENRQFHEAMAAYRRAIAAKPDYPQAYYNLAIVLQKLGQLDDSIAAYRRAIELKPTFTEAHDNLGTVLKEKGRLDDAIAAYGVALSQRPMSPELHFNQAIALAESGQIDAAIAAYRRAIALRPNFPQAYNNLGKTLTDVGRLDEAVAAHRTAITLAPDFADAYSNLGNTLKDMGEIDHAIEAYRKAIALDPTFLKADSNLVFALQYHAGSDAAAIAREHRRWNLQHADPLRRLIPRHANDRDPDRRLKIGYVSPDFRDHCQSFFTIPLLSQHNHKDFEIVCYADVPHPDSTTKRLQSYADVWRSTVGQSDDQLAAQIQQDRIDILVDLTMHMAGNRPLLFARKPAPVQVCWLAYPASTGMTTIDYRLSDPYLDPPGMDESVYSEKTLRLPDTFWCFDPLDGREIPVNALPVSASGSITLGCLNNFCKINQRVLVLWAQVLREVQNSRLILLAPEGAARRRALDQFTRAGIDPARIEFVARQSRRQYLQTYHRMDLGLDSFPYNGHTTSLDSFWMGVPVITLVGERAVSRAGWSQLSNLRLTELAAHTPEQFVQIALELAGDLPRLAELRSTLRQRMLQSPLMDAPKFARDMEAAFRRIWHTYARDSR